MVAPGKRVQLIRLEPENISFDMAMKEPSVTLRVYNTSEKMVAFKVKTTHPKRYLVRPNQDVIPVDGMSSVKISLQIKDAKQLRQQHISGAQVQDPDWKDNKFLLQSAVVKEQFLEEIQELHENCNTKELGTKLKDMWIDTTKDEFVNRKLTCLFDYPNDLGVLMEVNNLQNSSGVPFAREVGPGEGAEARGEEDIVELRKKYNELINFTVQLTAERDRFKASLKEATKEAQLLKKGQQARVSDVHSLDREAERTPQAEAMHLTFSLWQIMLVAALAFLVGRVAL